MEVLEKGEILNRKEKWLSKKWNIIALSIIALAAFVMISPQLFKHSMILGNDMMFHFNRFYDAHMQLKTGNFNYFQSIFGFDQTGRIVNALYGPDFAYLQGLLMFLTSNWYQYQLLTSFLCFFIAGISMFFLAKKVIENFKVLIFISLLYMSCSMVAYYALSQNMTSWGAAFAPLIYIPAMRVIKDRKKPIKPIELALAVTSVGFLHNLTLLIGIISSVPFYLAGFFRADHKIGMLKDFSIAILLTLLLNINTLIGFIDVYLSNHLVYPKFFENVLSYSTHFTIGDNSYLNLGFVFSIIMLFQTFYLFFNWKNTTVLERLLTITGALFLVLSSNFLPWEDFAVHFEFVRIIQFPRRLALVAYIFLLISFGVSLEKIVANFSLTQKNIISASLCTVAFLMIANVNLTMLEKAEVWETDHPTAGGNNGEWVLTNNPDRIRNSFISQEYEDAFRVINKPTPDYLPLLNNTTQDEIDKLDGYKLYDKQIVHNNLNVTKKVDNKNRLVLTWKSENNDRVILPAIVYARSQIIFNGKEYNPESIQKTTLGAPIVQSGQGKNKVTIGYRPVVNVQFVLFIKFITIGAVGIIVLLNKFYKKFIS